ncbi:hypothetical protein [Chromobacterium sp. LK11]|uniref:hypothetical protein n=1 Tax=Chromobacterium sp. LK11 TaxID=1628212 RepID=UPI000AB75B44|nr:hypothetical protein [Chromobacterium sp. LK11]
MLFSIVTGAKEVDAAASKRYGVCVGVANSVAQVLTAFSDMGSSEIWLWRNNKIRNCEYDSREDGYFFKENLKEMWSFANKKIENDNKVKIRNSYYSMELEN